LFDVRPGVSALSLPRFVFAELKNTDNAGARSAKLLAGSVFEYLIFDSGHR